ncbi:MAG: 50S ribosomal protein L25 [Hungatella hathewayi]|uniref:50S ribosomal protein L25 n=1 Tax=Hungatella TaxID=1649459 RepID=UPI001106C5D9|nr:MULTISPECIES: 50S ribosomal protein L25 [Hungatella]MCI7381868.1 50S ribosomal protein L25 [Hungatella sp.]MDY6236829.1 50S ribosomal protein L25 [Hungatella hathewayi]
MNTLKAEKRSMSIKAKRLRREGYVTGNVFGRDIQESIPVKIEKTVVERLLKTCNKGSQILLDVDGQAYDVLIKDISFNAMKGIVEEIDFQALVRGEKVHSVAEVILVNHDKVMNGVLQQQLQEISYKALPEALIDKVRIDVGDMKVGDTIRVADLDIAKNKNVDLVTDLDTTVATVTAVHAAAEEPAEGTEEAASETK